MHPGIQATTLVGRSAGSTLLCGIQTTLLDCAAPPGWWQEPSLSSHPETALLMWQSNGAHGRYLLELVIHYDDLVSISLCA